MTKDEINQFIKTTVENGSYLENVFYDVNFGVTLSNSGGAFILKNPYDKSIPIKEDIYEIVIRGILSFASDKKQIEKVIGTLKAVYIKTLQANDMQYNEYTEPTFELPGYEGEYFRMSENNNNYEIRLYSRRNNEF